MIFARRLISELNAVADTAQAEAMQDYMKGRFLFFGVKAPVRKAILKELWTKHKAEMTREHILDISKNLFEQPQRELHYCAVELVSRYLKKKFYKEDIAFVKHLIITHSWWDTVDMIAKHHLGGYIKLFPEQKTSVIKGYSESSNMWLNRSAILFQLDYKEATDSKLLFHLCLRHKDTGEFFINKAIGWALREYGKYNPKAVMDFVSASSLAPLSEKEALRKLI